MRCPVCGDDYDDEITEGMPLSASSLSAHIWSTHGKNGCWCGYRSDRELSIRPHIMQCGGYDQHWTDFLMGACNGVSESQG